MIVLIGAEAEGNHNFRIERISVHRLEVFINCEAKLILTARQRCAQWWKDTHATIGVGDTGAERLPIPRALEGDADSARRLAERRIQDVRAERAHAVVSPTSSFSSRSRVILRCSSAATRSSTFGALCKRPRAKANISSALRPVAQTM